MMTENCTHPAYIDTVIGSNVRRMCEHCNKHLCDYPILNTELIREFTKQGTQLISPEGMRRMKEQLMGSVERKS